MPGAAAALRPAMRWCAGLHLAPAPPGVGVGGASGPALPRPAPPRSCHVMSGRGPAPTCCVRRPVRCLPLLLPLLLRPRAKGPPWEARRAGARQAARLQLRKPGACMGAREGGGGLEGDVWRTQPHACLGSPLTYSSCATPLPLPTNPLTHRTTHKHPLGKHAGALWSNSYCDSTPPPLAQPVCASAAAGLRLGAAV